MTPSRATRVIRSQMRFGGRIDPDDLMRFAEERVALLDLSGRVWRAADHVLCEVSGPVDLVDAFELACLLGPPGSIETVCRRLNAVGDGIVGTPVSESDRTAQYTSV